jgi:hypothetical protein
MKMTVITEIIPSNNPALKIFKHTGEYGEFYQVKVKPENGRTMTAFGNTPRQALETIAICLNGGE